jgi:hypothetical protein
MSRYASRSHLPIVLSMLLAASWCGAAPRSFTEDFASTTYKDTAATTAEWDTVAGELRLPAVELALLGQLDPTEVCIDLVVEGLHAFVACHASGFLILDVSDPTAPAPVSSHATPDACRRLAVDGDYLYAAVDGAGLQIFDISDLTAPTLVGSLVTSGYAYGLAVDGDRVYMVCDTVDLHVIDVDDPTAPVWRGTAALTGRARDVVADGNHLYIAGYDGGAVVVDVSNPAVPAEVAAFPTTSARGVALDGDLLYVADYSGGVRILDVTDPAVPVELASLVLDDLVIEVTVSGDLLFACDYQQGLKIIDVADPATPVVVDQYDTSSYLYDAHLAGGLVYLVDYYGGLTVLELYGPPILSQVGSTGSPGYNRGVDVAGDLAFVAHASRGLLVYDIGDLAAPTLVDSLAVQGQPYDVEIRGDQAFVADYDGPLWVFDVSDPTAVTLVDSCLVSGNPRALALAGEYAFVAAYFGDLAVVDISDPTDPAQVGSLALSGIGMDVAVAGNHAFVAAGYGGLQVVDVTTPASPAAVQGLDLSYDANCIAVSGDQALLGLSAGFFVSVDITDPAAPVLADSYFAYEQDPWRIQVSGRYACVGDAHGLTLFDVSDPYALVPMGTAWTALDVVDLRVAGNHAIRVYNGGLDVVKLLRDDFDTSRNRGQSLAVDGADDTIVRIRMTSTQTATVDWHFSADGGAHWQGINPGGSLGPVNYEGTDLLWRTTHTQTSGNPTVSGLAFEWLNDFAPIASIADVPDDQGGAVRLHLTRSGYDFAGETTHPVSGYQVYQRVDDPALVARARDGRPRVPALDAFSASLPPDSLRELDGRSFVLGEATRAGTFPQGVWEVVGTILPTQSDEYLIRLTTTADSTSAGIAWSTYVVTTHTTTPSVWYVCPPDSGYSVDNLAPSVPTGLLLAGDVLSWDPCPDEDFDYFAVYGSDAPELDGGAVLLGYTTGTNQVVDPSAHDYLLVTATDFAGNEGEAAVAETATAVETIPGAGRLLDAVPNPFNPSTTLSFELAEDGVSSLRVYDAAGRVVVTLVDERRDAGRHEAVWDGRDAAGRMCPAGVYLYRLVVGGFSETKRMVLLK